MDWRRGSLHGRGLFVREEDNLSDVEQSDPSRSFSYRHQRSRVSRKDRAATLPNSEWEALAILYRRQVFQRVWIIQEFAMVRHVKMMCGSHMIDFSLFRGCRTKNARQRMAQGSGRNIWSRLPSVFPGQSFRSAQASLPKLATEYAASLDEHTTLPGDQACTQDIRTRWPFPSQCPRNDAF